MTILQLVLGALTGTSLMTFFSYIVALWADEPFLEPKLLNRLVARSRFDGLPSTKSIIGWVLHYSMGTVFTICYYLFWEIGDVELSLESGIVLATINAVVGIGIWIATFHFHLNPPDIDLKKYYFQLFFAHLVFGMGVTAVFLLLENIHLHQ